MLHRPPAYNVNNRSKDKSVQVKVLGNRVVMGYGEGTLFWCTPHHARMLLQQNAIAIIGGDKLPPEEDAGKSSDARPTGPSTDTASSTQSGPATQQSASAEAPASPQPNANGSQPPAPQTDAGSSQSTPPTSDARGQTSSTSPTTGGGSSTERTRGSGRLRG